MAWCVRSGEVARSSSGWPPEKRVARQAQELARGCQATNAVRKPLECAPRSLPHDHMTPPTLKNRPPQFSCWRHRVKAELARELGAPALETKRFFVAPWTRSCGRSDNAPRPRATVNSSVNGARSPGGHALARAPNAQPSAALFAKRRPGRGQSGNAGKRRGDSERGANRGAPRGEGNA